MNVNTAHPLLPARKSLPLLALPLAIVAACIFGSHVVFADAPAPSWWGGTTCDTNNYAGSYQLSSGATYDGVIACGPGPYQGGTDHAVNFYKGAWGENEWECVELVMRFMYLVYGVAPYNAPGGKDVVGNYSGTTLTQVTNNGSSLPTPGDIVSEGPTSLNAFGHTGVVSNVGVTNGSGTVTIIQQNVSNNNGVGTITVSNNTLGSNVTGWLQPTKLSRYALTNGGGALYASDYPTLPLTNESSTGDAPKIAVGGAYQVRETGGGQMVWASSPGSSWQAITNTGVVTNVAVGSAGVFMYMDNCGAVYTNNQPSMTGWYQETGCGAKAISAGGKNIAYVDSTNTAFAATAWNVPATRISNVGDATNIAVSSGGMFMMVTGCGAAYSNDTISTGGWHMETGCGDTSAIATGGSYVGLINGSGTAWASTTWNGQLNQISNAGDAHALSMNDMPRVLMISSCNAAYAKDDVNNNSNWVSQTGCGDATAIAG